MSDRYSDGLADVVQQTVLMMCRLDARIVEKRTEMNREAPFDVSGIIGVTGAARGSIVISMPIQVAQKLACLMLRQGEDQCTEQDISDCVGELTNIVAGNLLAIIEDGNDSREARISLPNVVVGPHRVVWSSRDVPCELTLFETEVGTFAAELNLREAANCTVGVDDAEDLAD